MTRLFPIWLTERISIHAPTRGATITYLSLPPQSGYFNPRSHKGSDGTPFLCYLYDRDFNPRSHKGSDWNRPRNSLKSLRFQSTLPQGERLWEYGTVELFRLFQSTLPQGERLFLNPLPACHSHFNPRSHKGSDSISLVEMTA